MNPAPLLDAKFFMKNKDKIMPTSFLCKKKYISKSGAGFTLLEVLVAISIFVFIASTVSAIFINILKSQRKSFRFQEVQDNGSYIMEMISREIRMSGVDADSGPQDIINIVRNDNGDNIAYSFDENNFKILRNVDSSDLSRETDWLPINSDKVKINNLQFYVSYLLSTFENSNYHRVTIVLGLESAEDPLTNINLETTITSRPPPCASGICQKLTP